MMKVLKVYLFFTKALESGLFKSLARTAADVLLVFWRNSSQNYPKQSS